MNIIGLYRKYFGVPLKIPRIRPHWIDLPPSQPIHPKSGRPLERGFFHSLLPVRIIARRATITLLFLLSFAFTLGAQPPSPPPITEIDHIVAVVNDEVIVASELKNRIHTVLAESGRAAIDASAPAALKKQVLERLIIELLQIQVARRAGIQIGDEQLNRTIATIAQRNGLSLRQFREVLERDGYDFPAFRRDIRHRLMIKEIQKRRVADRVQITDREIDNYLSMRSGEDNKETDYHLGHILIMVGDSTNENEMAAARKKAQDAIGRLRAGADFSKMAMAISDSRKALKGGDLGWRKKEQLPDLFANVVPGMTPGEVSEPLWDSSGFHIIKLIELRGQARHIVIQTKARHILLRTDEVTSDTDAEIRLEQIRERIIQGEDFEELARSHSDDRGTAIQGGNLGWASPGDVVPRFEQEMDKLRPMEISEPFRTQFGWHIVQVLERRKYDGTQEVRRTQARGDIRKRKIGERLQVWLRQLRDEAYVEYRLEQ
uniref:Chaperone SurA n=1 Tax=Candidatus Kentrum sp. FM TaxID=2126340 RepID=A0A450TE03_9GAMM|nr:MAG: peptidyl-prolyl cis-trans isomerase SurA [Candidatus Kentron sp. FM]VFJ65230.1 MAG: peptidyl-prolyl cis-trans isomerase SurA [Candidatus Kentron sp. FM]VFK06103.1 MAG: peptidyl-prolyl cis-trans isomerase SurA [Candidatus Kentron sp. FM]